MLNDAERTTRSIRSFLGDACVHSDRVRIGRWHTELPKLLVRPPAQRPPSAMPAPGDCQTRIGRKHKNNINNMNNLHNIRFWERPPKNVLSLREFARKEFCHSGNLATDVNGSWPQPKHDGKVACRTEM